MASTSDDSWILGIHMTKFGKHPDEDMVDLAAEAVRGAMADSEVTTKDMGIIGAGNLVMAQAPIGQMLQKQLVQTGIPVYNVTNACAIGATALRVAAMAVEAGESDLGLAFGVEKLPDAGLLSGDHHLRGEAGDRQIEGAKVGLAHVIGLDSARSVTILEGPS